MDASWVQVAAFLLALLGFYGAIERRLSSISERVARIETKLSIIWRRLNDDAKTERLD